MAEQNYNIPNLYVDLIRKIKQIEGVDIEYIDRLVAILYNDINLIGNAVDSIMSYIPSGTSDENQLVNDSGLDTIELDLSTLTASVSHIDMCMPGTASSTNKLATLADIPAQVNSDWNALSGVAQILNKPTIKKPVTKTQVFSVSNWSQPLGETYWRSSYYIADNFDTNNAFFVNLVPVAPSIIITPEQRAAYDLVFYAETYTVQGATAVRLYATEKPLNDFTVDILYYTAF